MRCFHWLVPVLDAGFFFSVQVDAQERGQGVKTPAPPLIVAPSTEEPRVYIALTSEHRFSFAPPRGWNVSCSQGEKKMAISEASGRTVIQVEFKDNPGILFDASSKKQWIASCQKDFVNWTVQDEPSVSVLQNEAFAVDLTSPAGEPAPRSARIVRAAANPGYLEFSMNCSSDQFGSLLPSFMQCLSSFRCVPSTEPLAVRRFRPE
jgi:hypothetical protein